MSVHNPTDHGAQRQDAKPGWDAALLAANDALAEYVGEPADAPDRSMTYGPHVRAIMAAVYPVIVQAFAADPDALLLTGYQRSQKTGWKRASWKPEVEPVRGYPGADVEYVRDIFAGPWRLVGDKGEHQ